MYGSEGEAINANKLFRIISYSDGTYGFVCTVSNQYVDLDAGTCADGTEIHTWESSMGGKTQKWRLTPIIATLDSDTYMLKVSDSNGNEFAMDIAGSGKEAKANVQLSVLNGAASQRFQFIPKDGCSISSKTSTPAAICSPKAARPTARILCRTRPTASRTRSATTSFGA